MIASRPKTALVFAGGGSFGAIQVGMLKSLVDAGVSADLVVGSSVGAINGAHFAAEPTADGVSRLERLWRQARREDVFPVNLRGVLRFARYRDNLVDPAGLRSLVGANLPFSDIENARIPLHIIATDLLTGNATVLSRGPALDAIVASAAVPVIYPPVAIGGRHLVDAALSSNTPVKIAVSLGARRIIVLPTGFACALTRPPAHAFANALHAITLLIASQLVRELEALGPEVDYCIVPPLCPLEGSPYDFARVGPLIDAAEASTRSWIENGGLETRRIPDQLRPHTH